MAQFDLHQQVTDQIIAAIEAGAAPWHKPWSSLRPLRSTGQPYRGINILLLAHSAEAHGYTHTTWMTYKQAQELGGCVRKGEKGTGVVFSGRGTEEPEQDGEEGRRYAFLKRYTVFNVEQIDDLPELLTAQPAMKRIGSAAVAAYVEATGATIIHGGDRAYYRPLADEIHMPDPSLFLTAGDYDATLVHELVHWTGHASRLARLAKGPGSYAFEELVAEIGAAFLGARLGYQPSPRADHASYIAGWLTQLRDDKRAIFRAAAQAQRAADFLDGLQPVTEEIATAA